MASSICEESATNCKFCEKKVTVKCMDCNLFMCSSCSSIHSKVKNADTHTVLDVSKIAEYEECNEDLNVEFKPIKCNLHRRKMYSIFCNKCEKFVCTECISSTHQQHLLCELNKGFEFNLKVLLELNDKVDDDTYSYLRRLKDIENIEGFKYKKTLKEIAQKRDQAIAKVNTQYENATERVKSIKTLYTNLTVTKYDKIYKDQAAIADERSKLTELSKSGDMAKFDECAKRYRELLYKMKDFLPTTQIKLKTIMCTGGIPLDTLNVFVEDIDLTEIEIKVKAKYATKTLPKLDNITMACDREGCIMLPCERFIYCIDPRSKNPVEDKFLLNISQCQDLIDQICSASNDEIFILCGNRILKNDNKTWLQIADLSSFQPTSMCMNLSGEMIVGMCFGAAKSDKEDNICLLFLRQDGQTKDKITATEMRLKYNSITHCCLLKDDTICFSETDRGSRGRVVKLKKDKSIDLSYERNNTASSDDRPFCPVALYVTASDNLVVLTKSNCLDIITNRFQLVVVIDLNLVGITDSLFMCKGNDGVLWITTDDYSLVALEGAGF